MVRRAKLRRVVLAKLLAERGEDEDEGDELDDTGDDHKLVKFLIGRRMVRRAKLRRLVLAKLLSERGEDDGEEDFDTDEEETEGLGPVGKAALFGTAKRRQRVRRADWRKRSPIRTDNPVNASAGRGFAPGPQAPRLHFVHWIGPEGRPYDQIRVDNGCSEVGTGLPHRIGAGHSSEDKGVSARAGRGI